MNPVSRDSQLSIDARKLLNVLRENECKCADETRKISGLPPSQFAAAIHLLRKKGLIRKAERGYPVNRRRPPRFEICGDYGHVVAVDIGGTNLRVVLADMAGAIVGKWSASTKGKSRPAQVVRQIQRGVKRLLKQTGVPKESLLAIAAGAPGVTDSKKGIVLLTSYLGGWKDVALGAMLERALHIPAVLENDVRLGAVGERWRGSGRGLSDFVFLAVGTGIAAGIYINGELLHGKDGVAGEVGYMIVPGTSEAGVGEGQPGALESAIGGEGIRTQWHQLTQSMSGEARHGLSATEIFECALAGDKQAQSVLERSARMLAQAVYNISVVLNCSLFILGGGVGMSAILRDWTQKVLQGYAQPTRPEICLSSLGPDAQLIGAVRLALDAAEKRIGLGD